MKSRRVLIAGLFHETHTFVEQPTRLDAFQIRRGSELWECAGDSSPMGGALKAAREFGWTVFPVVDFRASPSGMVEDEVVESFWREFLARAQPALASGIDAIYLVLHGAMVSQSFSDVEGEILERIRRLPGAATLPIFGVFDLHANFTQRMATHSNGLVAYRENPHTDAREAAQRAARLLQRTFETSQIPRTYWAHPPLMWPPTGTATSQEPMLGLERMAREVEAQHEEIWTVNVAAGFSFADTPETGVSFSIISTGPEAVAQRQLERLSQRAWENRHSGVKVDPSVDSVLPQVLAETRGLTVLVEPSDNIGAGAPGAGTGLLRALIEHNVANAAVSICDPASVRRLQDVPIGTNVVLAIGGTGSALDPGPLTLEVELVSRSDGKFQLEDQQSHLASMAGDSFDMGSCAVVRKGSISILLTSRRTPPFDLGQWRSQGVEPTTLSVIGVKAAVAHRRAYDPIAARMFWVDTPGPCSSHLANLPYRKVRRPVFPLDE